MPLKLELKRSLAGVCVCTVLLFMLGCGGNDGNIPVTGDVKLASGEGLGGATVRFRSEDGKNFMTTTDFNGHFTLKADDKSAGIPAGEYSVVIQEAIGDDIDAPSRPKIHRKYLNRESTDLKVTVSPEQTSYDFTLDPPG